MTEPPPSVTAVQDILFREARLLDAQRWDEWLEMYCEDAVFWVPAVTMSGAYTTDPQVSLNFIYIVGRIGLEARVFRVESGGSLASNPLPRTRHLVTNVMVDDSGPDEVRAFANSQVAAFCEVRGQQMQERILRVRASQAGRPPADCTEEGAAARIRDRRLFRLLHHLRSTSSMEAMQRVPVLIVGGGPVGLALAAELGWRGIACKLVEQGDGRIVTPKMNEVNVRTMEFCRRWGIADDVHACPFPPDYPLDVAFVTSLAGYELGRMPRPPRMSQQPESGESDAAAGLLADVVRSDSAAVRMLVSPRELALPHQAEIVR